MSFAPPSYKAAHLLSDMKVPCLFWTDDLVLISTTKGRLQKQIEFPDKYCNDWKLTLNVEKNKNVNL